MVTCKKIIILILCFYVYNVFGAQEPLLRIPLHATEITLDPAKIQDFSSLWVSRQISCQLVRATNGVMSMEAAENIQYLSPTSIKIKLRPGIFFSNNKELTATDVVTSFQYLRRNRTTLRNVFNWVDEMAPLSKGELLIKLKSPAPQLFTVLSGPLFPIFESSFLQAATADVSRWNAPVSCGGYHIVKNSFGIIKLESKKTILPIEFHLVNNIKIPNDKMNDYDIILSDLVDEANKNNNFTSKNTFDPYQYYFVINTKKDPWQNKNKRCSVLAKIDPSIPMKSYGDNVRLANDYLPSGTLAYSDDADYIAPIKEAYRFISVPKKPVFKLALVTSAIQSRYREGYLKMIKNIYPITETIIINSFYSLPDNIVKQKFDAVIFADKSGNMDAYEYIVETLKTSGYEGAKLWATIENSQEIIEPATRASKYRLIIKEIRDLCVVYPLFTTPYNAVFVKKGIITPNIEKGAFNDYYLGQVYKVNNK